MNIQTHITLIYTHTTPKYNTNMSRYYSLYVHVYACTCLYMLVPAWICMYFMPLFFSLKTSYRHIQQCMYLLECCIYLMCICVCIRKSLLYWSICVCISLYVHASAFIACLNTIVRSFSASIKFNAPQQGSPWAKSWPTSWCRTDHCQIPGTQYTPWGKLPKAGVFVTVHVVGDSAIISMSWMCMYVCVCIIVYLHVSAFYTSVCVCIGMYLLVSRAWILLNVCMCMYVYVCLCMWLYVQSLGGSFQGQWEQCATPGTAPIPLYQLALGFRWDLQV